MPNTGLTVGVKIIEFACLRVCGQDGVVGRLNRTW